MRRLHCTTAWTGLERTFLDMICILSRHGGVCYVGVIVDCRVLAR